MRPSKGRARAGKQRKTAVELGAPSTRDTQTQPADGAEADNGALGPPMPTVASHVLVGLNTVTRHLSDCAEKYAPRTVPAFQHHALESESPRRLSLIVLPHPMPSSSLPHAHLPTLAYLSSVRSDSPTRLVALSTAFESRLASVLHLPRVGAIGILEGAPGADSVVDYVREHVEPVQCDWLEEAWKAEWKGLKTAVRPL